MESRSLSANGLSQLLDEDGNVLLFYGTSKQNGNAPLNYAEAILEDAILMFAGR